MIHVQGYVQDYDAVCLNGDLSMWECHYSMWRILPLTWTSNLFWDSKIRFNFKSNLTSAISNFSKSRHLASYVSCHNAMAYDTRPHKWSYQMWKLCRKRHWYGKISTITIQEVIEDLRIVLLSKKHKILWGRRKRIRSYGPDVYFA
jgi:hypothetical protein